MFGDYLDAGGRREGKDAGEISGLHHLEKWRSISSKKDQKKLGGENDE